jgi:hypothetical protein
LPAQQIAPMLKKLLRNGHPIRELVVGTQGRKNQRWRVSACRVSQADDRPPLILLGVADDSKR